MRCECHCFWTGHNPLIYFGFFVICFFLLSIFKGFDLPLSFQRFLSPPIVLVTPIQQSPGRPQDSMAIWVEYSLEHGFNVCLRETKIFDGLHQNIKIVSTQTVFNAHTSLIILWPNLLESTLLLWWFTLPGYLINVGPAHLCFTFLIALMISPVCWQIQVFRFWSRRITPSIKRSILRFAIASLSMYHSVVRRPCLAPICHYW